MANGRGYLGKISAVVSANTGDYVRKLDDSAKRTAAFARTIQSDLTKASREASRSIDAILTPLQRFERAIQNAASARLKFRGIDVAVRTIEDLRRSLAALDSDQEKEFAVRVSGLRNITELKNVLTDIREEDIDLAVNVGGVEGLRRLRNEVQEVNGQQVNIRTERTAAELDTLIAKFSRLSPDRIREIRIAVEARQLDAAILKERQLVSLAKEIAAPLSASVAQFDQLTLEVQAGFIPALSAAQNRVEAVRDRIEAGGQIGQRAFRRIADEVRQTTEAIGRLAEAQRLVQSIGTGRSLRDTSPRQFDALTRAAEQSRRSEQVSAQVAAQFGLGDRQQRVGNLAGQVSVLQARRESQEQDLIAAKKAKNSTLEAEIQRRLQLTIQYEARKTAELERQLGIQLRQIEAAEEFQGKSQLVAKGGFVPLSDLQRQAASLAPSTVTIDDPFGEAIDSSIRRFGVLQSSINSVKGLIDQLPIPLQSSFVPALAKAEADFDRLKFSGAATAEEIAKSAEEVRRLRSQVEAATRLVRPDGLFPRGTGSDAVKDFEAVERAFRFVGATTSAARAPLEEWRQALQQAVAEGTTSVPAVRAEIDRLRKAAIDAGAAFGGISTGKFLAVARNFGDVGRAGVDKFALALNQLAFVFDDLTSASGGLDMKFRAIQNNLTQIGFILGNTAGLWIALGAAIGGTVVIQIVKWLYQTDLQKARLEELNDALRSQQSAVTSLADAYARLAQEIARAGASGFEARAATRDDRVQEIRRIAQERQRQTVAELSPEVANIRGERALLEERLRNERDLRRRVELQNQIERNRRQEQAAVGRGVPAPDAAGVRDQLIAAEEERVRQTQVRLNRARLRERLGGVPPPGEDVATLEEELRQRRADLTRRQNAAPAAGRREQLVQLRGSLADLEAQRARVVAGGARTTEIDQAIDDVTTAIRRIEASLAPAVQRVVEQVTRQSLSIAATLEDGARFIADSLGDSPEARDLRRAIRATAEEVSRLQTAASNASTPDEAREAQAQLGRQRRRAEELRARAQQVQAAAAIDPQSLFQSRAARASQNIQDSGLAGGAIARSLRELEARRQSLVSDLESENPFARRRAEKGLQAIDEEIRALEAATLALKTFADGLNRAAQVVQSDLDASRQDAAGARRRDLGVSTPQSRREREARAADFRDQQDAARRAQRDIDIARGRLEDEVKARGLALGVNDPFARIAVINEQLQSGAVVGKERDDLIAERDRLLAAIQPLADAFNLAAEEITASVERLREVSLLAAEGRELSLTPAERAGEQLARQLEAVRVAFATEAERTTGLIDQAGQREAQQRVLADNIRQVAPLRAQFTEEVANAVLQGPSRAALQASDATTVEGNRELSRLLRGDDPARDVNLIELQRQTQALEELLRIAREQGVLIAE